MDVCTFNEQFGIVKDIGLRSTQIRLFDRSVLTIPNAQFADLEIINWAECDMMLIHETIRLKYETSAEQISQVLMNIRSLLELHPQIDSETIRVRLKEYGESSLNIDMRIYAQTKEWNEFFKIREEVLLKIKASIEEVGVSFALPAQSLYLQDQENKNLTQKNNF